MTVDAACLRGLPRRQFDLTKLISHRFPLEEAVEAIDLASHPQADSMKIVIQP